MNEIKFQLFSSTLFLSDSSFFFLFLFLSFIPLSDYRRLAGVRRKNETPSFSMTTSNEILILERGGLVGSIHLWRDIPATLKSLINATRNVAAFCTTTDAYLSSSTGPTKPAFLPPCVHDDGPYVCTCVKTSRELKLG